MRPDGQGRHEVPFELKNPFGQIEHSIEDFHSLPGGQGLHWSCAGKVEMVYMGQVRQSFISK